jgi:metallophosphoesterase (TIGR00282 family)
MKVLFVGDVVGRSGRKVLSENVQIAQEEHGVDFTVVNVENCAGGFGATPKLAEKILSSGVDVLTSGNHIWDRREIFEYLERQPRLLRPGNYPSGLPGNCYFIGESRCGASVGVLNLQGRVFMPLIDCPFQFVEDHLEELREKTKIILVDFHAEATSEKMAFGWFVDGKVSALVGTHTHVPTADARVLPGGCAYITDVGMTGAYDSVIGMQIEGAMRRFQTGLSGRLEPAVGSPRFSSVVIDIDEDDGTARSIERCDYSLEG